MWFVRFCLCLGKIQQKLSHNTNCFCWWEEVKAILIQQKMTRPECTFDITQGILSPDQQSKNNIRTNYVETRPTATSIKTNNIKVISVWWMTRQDIFTNPNYSDERTSHLTVLPSAQVRSHQTHRVWCHNQTTPPFGIVVWLDHIGSNLTSLSWEYKVWCLGDWL